MFANGVTEVGAVNIHDCVQSDVCSRKVLVSWWALGGGEVGSSFFCRS